MKKKLTGFFVAALVCMAVACSKDNGPLGKPDNPGTPVTPPAEEILTKGVYILNSGKMGSNNSELTYYDAVTGQVKTNVFETVNGKKMGDTGNCIVCYGKKLYIAVSGSAVVYVTDLTGRILGEVVKQGESGKLSPRHLDAANGKVYVTYMEGYAGAIDTSSFQVTTVKVGAFPEGIAYSNKKVYVANSDGMNYPYGTTVTVLDANTLETKAILDVASNPQTFHKASDNTLYLVAWGNYADIPAQLQKINTSTDRITTISGVAPTNMAIGMDGIAYILSSVYDASWNQTITYEMYDIAKDKIIGEFAAVSEIPGGYSLFADELTGKVYMGASDYISNGDVYVLESDGAIAGKFDTGALNPVSLCFIR